MFLNARTRDSSTRGERPMYAEDTRAEGARRCVLYVYDGNFEPLARKPSPQTFYILRTFKTAKRLYLYVSPGRRRRRRAGFSFRDESYFCKCYMTMGGAVKLNYCLPFLQRQSFWQFAEGSKERGESSRDQKKRTI